MSEAPHGMPIKTPAQLVAAIIAGFAIPIIIIVLLAYYVDNSTRVGAGTDSLSNAEVSQRIAPLAQVALRDANAPPVYKTGEQVYHAVCATCHTAGTAGAPKFTSATDWAPYLASGFDTMWRTALAGKGAMPARGGTSPDDYSDHEIGLAVVYMANNAGAKFTDPPVPAATPHTESTAAAAPDAGASSAQAAAMAAIANVAQAPSPSAVASNSADAAQAGKALYQQVCQVCHAAGVLNAPKFGDKAAWAPRLKEPMETVYNYALHGKGAMPPKGGSGASDADVKAAVDYMVGAVK
ncbi:c-type cytochrome [Paraburkholderia bonniea]|uniref:c-type cytochrome n=1 Tax=Paraburkholderia bonniea TaxID=2152891 RepID=UPI0012913C40|nr:c-type cytochrome [Paraburkholderia bonniea]WJF90386.1 c-type cytochrome [Paraburkholderia bonniea]WJF93701.1 c-type cytochrome [Paraburkholderia bonniea]